MSRLLETFKVGALDVAALSDGAPDRALGGFFNGIDPALWMPAIGVTEAEQAVPFNFGTFLVRGDGRTVLIDSGYGPPAAAMGVPGGGEMLARLAEIGVTPGEVDTVVHTHLHLDHCGWDVDEGGAVVFPNARVLVAAAEI
ncbi:MAG TPA: MBL fold metallo-hydrolase, partial [Tepidiformaceae bacterium]|nr:MBL fold metallo-hydrolase [Tepidiformaceae bacterium]